MIKHTKQKRILIILFVSLFFVSPYFLVFSPTKVQGANVVDSIPSPGPNSQGLTWDGQYLWNSDVGNQRIYKLNPSTGAVVDSFSSLEDRPMGLAWDGEYLWHADINGKIYKLNPATGAVVDSFSSPGSGPWGLTWDGEYLWHADSYTEKIYKIDPATGAVVKSFNSPGGMPTGLTWDGHYLWVVGFTQEKIYKLNPSTGAVVKSFNSPGSTPTGLTWDGHYLWNADEEEDRIYKIDVEAEPITLVKIIAISCPDEIETDHPFTIHATIKNEGNRYTTDVTATIVLPYGFSLTNGSTTIPLGTITVGENKTVSWTAKASDPGDFSITISVSSAEGGSDYITETIHVKPSFAYTMATTYVGLSLFVWIMLMFAGIVIGLAVVIKKRGTTISLKRGDV